MNEEVEEGMWKEVAMTSYVLRNLKKEANFNKRARSRAGFDSSTFRMQPALYRTRYLNRAIIVKQRFVIIRNNSF
jgi:hypothetical protein